MGTKRALVPVVSEVVRRAQSGTLLDAFSGMCSVGEAVAQSRQVWNNDIQLFASAVASALFTSRYPPLSPLSCGDVHFKRFDEQRRLLTDAFRKSLAAERHLLQSTSFVQFGRNQEAVKRATQDERRSIRMRSPHLFATTYSGTYFGVSQAIDADAIVTAIRTAKAKGAINRDQQRWCLIALGRALLKIANSTGHFAQYLKPKPNNYRRYLRLRRRSLWSEWLNSIAELSPIGDNSWRSQNKVFNQDTLLLLPRLTRRRAEISVIYADPPYTDDQYSRFYHVLETLLLYDYPEVTGAGLYRPNRFTTPFSIKTSAASALRELIKTSAATGADLVLSYPTNGLANRAGANVRSILRQHFRRVEICQSVSHFHSTFGASKGAAQAAATELIYLARSA